MHTAFINNIFFLAFIFMARKPVALARLNCLPTMPEKCAENRMRK